MSYEKYRNKKEIKSRSVIEDFHSILGYILVLPEKPLENKEEIWNINTKPVSDIMKDMIMIKLLYTKTL